MIELISRQDKINLLNEYCQYLTGTSYPEIEYKEVDGQFRIIKHDRKNSYIEKYDELHDRIENFLCDVLGYELVRKLIVKYPEINHFSFSRSEKFISGTHLRYIISEIDFIETEYNTGLFFRIVSEPYHYKTPHFSFKSPPVISKMFVQQHHLHSITADGTEMWSEYGRLWEYDICDLDKFIKRLEWLLS